VTIPETYIYVNNTTVEFRDTQCETNCSHLAHVRKLLDQILKNCSLSYRHLVRENLWLEYTLAKTGL